MEPRFNEPSLLIARVKFESESSSSHESSSSQAPFQFFIFFYLFLFFRFHFDIFRPINCDSCFHNARDNDVPTAVRYIIHQKRYFLCQRNRESSLTAKAQDKQNISKTFKILFLSKARE